MSQSTDPLPSNTNWQGRVLLWDEQAIFIGLAADASLHASPAIKVCVALKGGFGLRMADDGEWTEHDSAIIAPGQPHAIDGRHHEMVMLLLVPEARLAERLAPIYLQTGITRLSTNVVAAVRSIFSGFEERITNGEPIDDVCFEMVEAISGGESVPIDSRVAQSIEWIRSSREHGVSVQEIAAGVELSESRFSHLFTENVRVPVRRYLLWLRLRDAIHLLARGGSLTETAHAAGFADSAHLTRTFRGMLGIAPSALVKESRLTSFLP
jgi:AraC family transcriptional regulator